MEAYPVEWDQFSSETSPLPATPSSPQARTSTPAPTLPSSPVAPLSSFSRDASISLCAQGIKRVREDDEGLGEAEPPRKRPRLPGRKVTWKPQPGGGQDKDHGPKVFVQERRITRWLGLIRQKGGQPAENELAAVSFRQGALALQEARAELLAETRQWRPPMGTFTPLPAPPLWHAALSLPLPPDPRSDLASLEEARAQESLQLTYHSGPPPLPEERLAPTHPPSHPLLVPFAVPLAPTPIPPQVPPPAPKSADLQGLLDSLRRLLPGPPAPAPLVPPPPASPLSNLQSLLSAVNAQLLVPPPSLVSPPPPPYSSPSPSASPGYGGRPQDQGAWRSGRGSVEGRGDYEAPRGGYGRGGYGPPRDAQRGRGWRGYDPNSHKDYDHNYRNDRR